mgnify:CR=1 FL=1
MNDFTLDNVNEMYIDVLREIGNIGAGNATTSLASMINEQIDMNVPKVELMEASKLSSAICPEDEIIVGIFLAANTSVKMAWIDYHPFYHVYMGLKNAFFGVPTTNPVYYAGAIGAIILLFLLVEAAFRKEMGKEG